MEKLFLDLLNQHSGIPQKVARCYCSNMQDQDDVVQEIHTQLWCSFQSYDQSRSFSTWMYRVAINVAISHLRRTKQKRSTLSLEGESIEAVAQPSQQPSARVVALQRFIAALDPLNRALMLLYLEDQPYRDIAEVLGISESNVGTKISRLKERIRNEITIISPEAEVTSNGN